MTRCRVLADHGDMEARLLQALTNGCIRRTLIGLDLATGEFPVPRQRHSCWTLADEKAIVVFDNSDRNNGRHQIRLVIHRLVIPLGTRPGMG